MLILSLYCHGVLFTRLATTSKYEYKVWDIPHCGCKSQNFLTIVEKLTGFFFIFYDVSYIFTSPSSIFISKFEGQSLGPMLQLSKL